MIIDLIIYYHILFMESVHYQKNQKNMHMLRKIYIILVVFKFISCIACTNEFVLGYACEKYQV